MWLKAAVIVFFVAFADCFLTPSQPACVGDVIEYNCSFVDSFIQWNYNAERIHASSIATLGSVRVTTSGIEFNISYSVNNDMIMSTIRFKVTEASNNSEITCMGLNLVNVAMETIHVIYPDFLPSITLVNKFTEYESGNTSVLFLEWIITNSLKPPTVNVSGYTMYEEMKNSTYLSISNFTIVHNKRYFIQVTASSCQNIITRTFSVIEVSCIFPNLHQKQIVWPSTIAFDGSRVYYSCGVNYYPNINYTTTCVVTEEVGTWIPYPTINCSRLCNSLPSSNAINYFNKSDIYLENNEVLFLCNNSSLYHSNVQSTRCTRSGTWFPDPLKQCMMQSESSTTLIPTTKSTMLVNTEDVSRMTSETSSFLATALSSFLAGFAGGVIVMIVVLCVILKRIQRRGKASSKHEQPSQLYEEIVLDDANKPQELKLQDNVAYGQVKN